MTRLVRAAALVAAILLIASGASAQSGRQPIRILAGFPPGGNVDLLARLFAERINDATGRATIVVNKPGAGGQIAAEVLKESTPDGDILMLAPDATVVVRPLIMTKPPYDPTTDFAAVAQTGAQDYAMALSAKIPPKSLREFAAWAKEHPDGANFGSSGEGGSTHFLGMQIGEAIGVPLRQVPFAGAGPAITAAVSGEISSTVQPIGTLVQQAKAGTIRIVAVTGSARNATFPDAPTLVELGYPKIQATSWFGVFAPAKTPNAVVDRLQAEIAKIVSTPAFQQKAAELGARADFMAPASDGPMPPV